MEAGELRDWQRRLRFTNRRAAEAVGLSPSGYEKQCSGIRPVSRQTEMLCRYAEIVAPAWLDIAQGAAIIGRRVVSGR